MSAAFIPRRRKLSADQFERVGRARILGEEVRVELIEGDMIEMAPIGSRHASAVNTLSMFCVVPAAVRAQGISVPYDVA
jgi:hypothetical protein